jgi:hypothetical protein
VSATGRTSMETSKAVGARLHDALHRLPGMPGQR